MTYDVFLKFKWKTRRRELIYIIIQNTEGQSRCYRQKRHYKQKQPRTTYTSELRINVTFQLQRTIFCMQSYKEKSTIARFYRKDLDYSEIVPIFATSKVLFWLRRWVRGVRLYRYCSIKTTLDGWFYRFYIIVAPPARQFVHKISRKLQNIRCFFIMFGDKGTRDTGRFPKFWVKL